MKVNVAYYVSERCVIVAASRTPVMGSNPAIVILHFFFVSTPIFVTNRMLDLKMKGIRVRVAEPTMQDSL